MQGLLEKTVQKISPINREAVEKAKERQDGLLKPPGSLGKLEDLSLKLAGIYGDPKPQVQKKAIVLMAADNGVYEEGYNSFPQEITKSLVELAGPGLIGVAVLSRHVDSKLVVVDIGIKGEVKGEHILPKKIRQGTANIAKGPAMSREEAIKAVETGIEVTNSLIDEGIGLLGTGEAGICNTTTTAAVISALTGIEPEQVVGMGTGGDEQAYQKKLQVVKDALALNKPNPKDPIDVLTKVGGLDIAGLVGCYLAAAARKKPIVIDGFIAGGAALCALKINPLVKDYMIPSHLSKEKGAQVLLDALDMEPMLLMNMRLGEGTGAALTFNIIDGACKIINEMGSFADLE